MRRINIMEHLLQSKDRMGQMTAFVPKFDNVKGTKVSDLLKTGNFPLLLAKKYSGSLAMVNGAVRNGTPCFRYAAKNSSNNGFTYVAQLVFECLMRAKFEENYVAKMQEMALQLERESLTLSFELITDVLGDHADRPAFPIAFLTAIVDNSTGIIWNSAKLNAFAREWGLQQAEKAIIAPDKALDVYTHLLDNLRHTADNDVIDVFLRDNCLTLVESEVVHKDLNPTLEGFVLQVLPEGTDIMHLEQTSPDLQYRDRLLCSLRTLALELQSQRNTLHLIKNEQIFKQILTVTEARQLLQEYSMLSTIVGKQAAGLLSVTEDKKLESCVRLTFYQEGDAMTISVNVMLDDLHYRYQKLGSDYPSLPRGLVWGVGPDICNVYAPHETVQSFIAMEKMKCVCYTKRTFGLRNLMSGLVHKGVEVFLEGVRRYLHIWAVPVSLHFDILQERKQFANWFLSTELEHWMRREAVERQGMGRNSWLSSYEAFLSAQRNDLLPPLPVIKNLILLVKTFPCSELPSEIPGYVLGTKSKKGVSAGCWTHCARDIPVLKEPHQIIFIAPTEPPAGASAYNEKMYFGALKAMESYSKRYPCALTWSSAVPSTGELAVLAALDAQVIPHPPPLKVVICFGASAPGCGKSWCAKQLLEKLTLLNIKAVVIASDDYARNRDQFEQAVITALKSDDIKVVIYDKCMPSDSGLLRMDHVIADVQNVKTVCLYPEDVSPMSIQLYCERVLSRDPAAHALNATTIIDGRPVSDLHFLRSFWGTAPAFHRDLMTLPQTFPLSLHGLQDTVLAQLHDVAMFVEGMVGCSSSGGGVAEQSAPSAVELQFIEGRYLAYKLCMCEDLSDKPDLHITVHFWGSSATAGRRAQLIAEGLPHEASFQIYRISSVLLEDGKKLHWASVLTTMQKLQGEPLHITLAAEGLEASYARLGEAALRSGSTTVVINELVYPIVSEDVELKNVVGVLQVMA